MLKRFAPLLVCLLLIPLGVQAQAPQTLENALADLSQRVGRTVTLADLTNWSFVQNNYPDSSLGCPQPGQFYSQIITPGVQFTITYAGITYDYRVSADRTAVILCGQVVAPTADPRDNCPPPGDSGYLTPRLARGGQGRVEVGGLPNLVRDQPGQSGALLGQMEGGTTFLVIDGPRCSTLDKVVWWQVNANGLIGWTAEGQNGEYWLEPLGAPGALVTPTSPPRRITLANAGQVMQIGAFDGAAALLPDGRTMLIGRADGGITLVNAASGQTIASVDGAHAGAVTALTVGQNAQVVLIASAGVDGLIKVWLPNANGIPTQRFQLIGHTGAVTAVAFSPDAALVASGGADNSVRLWDAATGAALAVLTGHTAPVSRILFGADGAALLTSDTGGGVRLWGLPGAAG